MMPSNSGSKSGSSVPSRDVPHDQQTSNPGSTSILQLGQVHMAAAPLARGRDCRALSSTLLQTQRNSEAPSRYVASALTPGPIRLKITTDSENAVSAGAPSFPAVARGSPA